MNTTPETASPHWAINYIGHPWSLDWFCWSLVRDVYQYQLGAHLPLYPVSDPRNSFAVSRVMGSALAGDSWEKIDTPEEFSVVTLSRKTVPNHVGVWTASDGGFVVHVQEHSCTVADSLKQLAGIGWSKIDFYKWRFS